ncbi:hypothetical protein HGA91_03465 [candidate division WWE3 bacterium]|nr:hypothetical protein [candidate division WWE3 bacterium]
MEQDVSYAPALHDLERELKIALDEFRNKYSETTNNQTLTNEQIYALVQGEYSELGSELQHIKEKALTIMEDIQKHHDEEALAEVLRKLQAL